MDRGGGMNVPPLNEFILILAAKDATLRKAYQENKGKSESEVVLWKLISRYFTDKTDQHCMSRWQEVLNPTLVKGPWTPEVRWLV
jgi:hypothetical protein